MASTGLDVPTFGVEEELLLVEESTGEPFMESAAVAHVAKTLGLDLDLELTPCQIETATPVLDSMADLRRHLVESRSKADAAAREMGGRVLAVGVPPIVGDRQPVSKTERYQRIAQNFGIIAAEQGVCGCHVHVAVPDRARAIEVSNSLRPWLPILVALTANSAIHRSSDSGYSSWRTMLWSRWPSAGAPPHLESEDEYDAATARLLEVGAALDEGMIYWDVRPSKNFPTIEVRVSDVPATVDETVLYATLVRALVMTALADGPPDWAGAVSSDAVRLAKWRAARDGLTGECPDLQSGNMIPARVAVDRLLSHIGPALDSMGEHAAVSETLNNLFRRGNGAMQQRQVFERSGAQAVVEHVAARTLETDSLR
ncbi:MULTISPECIES: glutamate--cysteine ligase [Actinomycetes]|uniref:glutamate--cysteine ligase n=1 Tax=Actinomycetes TaxID=1760 RepID=UPI000A89FC4C|nr:MULTISPECIES: glutamate--cysteine ligase [Actinomycetes]